MRLLAHYPGHEKTSTALRRAVELAADPVKVESLGGGWVSEEALAIAVYAALARTGFWKHRTPIESAFLLAVNHSGDSDSTGAICGNLLGAHHGDGLLPPQWRTTSPRRSTPAKRVRGSTDLRRLTAPAGSPCPQCGSPVGPAPGRTLATAGAAATSTPTAPPT